MRRYPFIFFVALLLMGAKESKMKKANIRIDLSKVEYTMKGGLGASWHAISREMPLNNEKYIIKAREKNPRGSAYGGNPPLSDTAVWNQLRNYAGWLGMNFIRVEISQRMYEPEQGQFDWDNDEMKALYAILDWCEENNADVFLQQMWANVGWNAIPGIHPLISAPKNPDTYTDGIATMVEYLTRTKGYNCIKYFCMTNEPPGGTWGDWWEYGGTKGSIEDSWKLLKEKFDKQKISVKISGPDWTDMPPFDPSKLEMASGFGSIDIHSYQGVTPEGQENLSRWAAWAHNQGKPFFLTEFGNMRLGWGEDNPGPKTFAAALSDASDVIRGIHAHVDGFNRWSFTNRGDLDGQWQLVHTWDRDKKQYLDAATPEPAAYYGFGIISRFLSKYSSSVSCISDMPDSVVNSAALVSPDGELSIFMVNYEKEPVKVKFNIASLPDDKMISIYQITEKLVSEPGYELKPVKQFSSKKLKRVLLPPESITTITSYTLTDNNKGIILK